MTGEYGRNLIERRHSNANREEGRYSRDKTREKRDRILGGYLRGQLAVITNFAIYYSLFAPVASALAGISGVGQARFAYSGAVAIFQPIAGVIAERVQIRTILIGTFILRAIIWTGLVPAAFLLLGTGMPFLTVFVALMCVDGTVVSIGSLVDIDEGGVDLLAQQHGFKVDDALRNRYNALYEGFSSISRIVMAPLMAMIGLVAAGFLQSATAALVIVMALSFILPASAACYYYLRYIPSETITKECQLQRTVGGEFVDISINLCMGVKLAWSEKRVRWRILFNGAERAIEDSMLLVVSAAFAMEILAPDNAPLGAFYTAVLIAFGKLGGIAAAWTMHKHWHAPVTDAKKLSRYKIFFPLALGGTLATALMPVAALTSVSSPLGSAGLAGLSVLLFNLQFTASALGFRNLMQGMVSDAGASGRLLGIQGTFIMGISAVTILGLSTLFATVDLITALVITSIVYVSYGIVQFFMGPTLLFPEECKG